MRTFIALVVPIIFLCLFTQYFGIVINNSDSLKHKLFLIRKGILPEVCGDYIVFRVPNNGVYEGNFVKLVGGMKGDVVTATDRRYSVNGRPVGYAKAHSKDGRPTNLGPVGQIPEGQYFVYTNHPDSYDSKYKEIGWVGSANVVGVAYPIF
ncbi:MAG: hypothetical protein K0R73_819 [Candidatus Midichloriaceae bacterium]|jgi:conjugal transfer pilin signal peptidase TrbI|nr:hypothetical protein [Candidatus Midichloriaceae bacterium]